MPCLSLCLIVRNEAAHLPEALGSMAGLADEVVVLDTGSTDDSPAIARRLGAAVYHHAWRDSFAEARNAALDRCSGDWVLMLDADERLAPEHRDRLRPLLDPARADAYALILRDLQPEGAPAAYLDHRATRLFRNDPAYRYEGAIHEQIGPAIQRAGGRIARSDLVLHHLGYQGPLAQGASRAARNLHLLDDALADAPDDPYLLYQRGVTRKSLGRGAEAEADLRRSLAFGHTSLAPDVLDQLHMRLAQLALAADRHTEALRHAEASLALRPDNLISLYAAGVAALSLGRPRRASAHLSRARRHPALRPDEAAGLDHLLTILRSPLP